MNISREDFGTLCICALRYCHGRRTYMPSLVQEIVGKHLKELSDKDIKVMVDDCQFQRHMGLYGDECDKVDWLEWEQKVSDEEIRRAIDKSEEAPTIDAVEVVRCKNCKYWHSNTEFCDVWSHMNIAQRTLADDYCSLAERREENEVEE